MSREQKAWGSAILLIGAAFLIVTVFLLAGRARSASAAAQALTPYCPASLVAGGHDYHGLPLTMCNFTGQDLSNASFKGATLTAVVFIRTNLTGADFSGATIADSGNAAFPTDFSFATLTNASFVKTMFNGPTYLTYATLTCADFSHTNINNGNAIFGDAPLNIDTTQKNCRTKFQNTTMNCEFVAQWDKLDLTGALISACASQLQTVTGQQSGHDFSNGIYTSVVFDNLDLTSSNWTGAVLEHASFQSATLDNATGLSGTTAQPSRLSAAKFNYASVQNVDLSNAQLYGAQFTNANLSNSSLAGAFLSANTAAMPAIETAAKFDGAHLKNVNLANANLTGASFRYASLYGSNSGAQPIFPCGTNISQCTGSPTGFTCGCATASGADLTGTDFSNAYLFGVDFRGATTTINGTKFGSAILVGASFANAKFQVNGGAAPDFIKALLQGAIFDSNANLVNTSLNDAFVDFGATTGASDGNSLYLLLSADYTRFRGWPGAGTPCVQATYATFTVVPTTVSMTCPNGSFKACGVGKQAPNPNPNWKGGIAMASNTPVPGWYVADATYDKATPINSAVSGAICRNNAMVDPNW